MTDNDKQAVQDAIFLLRSMKAAFDADAPAWYKLGICFLAFCSVVFKGKGAIPAKAIAEQCNITLEQAEHIVRNVDTLAELLEAADGGEEFLTTMKAVLGGPGGEA